MSYGVEIVFSSVEEGFLVVNKRRFLAHAKDESAARVFAKAWADCEGHRVMSINVFGIEYGWTGSEEIQYC